MEARPAVYVVSGPMAAGKTTVARLLAAPCHVVVLLPSADAIAAREGGARPTPRP